MKIAAFTLALLVAAAPALGQGRDDDDDPPEYKDRSDYRDAYRRGYERGFERGYQRGLKEGERRAPVVVAPPPPPPPVAVPSGPIRVTGAYYGSSSRNCDATRFMKRRADGKRTFSIKVTNEICGDPAHGDRKTLEVTYRCGEVSRTASAREHQTVYLNCN